MVAIQHLAIFDTVWFKHSYYTNKIYSYNIVLQTVIDAKTSIKCKSATGVVIFAHFQANLSNVLNYYSLEICHLNFEKNEKV